MTASTIVDGFARVRELGAADNWLAVLVTQRPSARADAPGDPSVSLVNAGVLPHPVTGGPGVAFVARGTTAKLANPRDPGVPRRLGVDRGPRPGRAGRPGRPAARRRGRTVRRRRPAAPAPARHLRRGGRLPSPSRGGRP